uniref:Coiled-coil domain containing 198 n=1 Tax=Rousettus aegyptiacus TaxID=9407 RepID=A0A7J8IHB4_ROUAE|nr:coiled-coil domain containing 198 [Rousettus aegyptiacus]
MTSERILRQQEGRTTHKAKELEKKMQTPMYISGKRQYLHKMQMLEMNRKRQEAQMELKKSHREARINKQKLRDHQAKKILQSIPKNDDGDFLTLLPDETLNRSPGGEKAKEPHLVVKEDTVHGDNVKWHVGISQFGATCRHKPHPFPCSSLRHVHNA